MDPDKNWTAKKNRATVIIFTDNWRKNGGKVHGVKGGKIRGEEIL